MERREGIEPSNNCFAGSPVGHFGNGALVSLGRIELPLLLYPKQAVSH